MPSRAVQHVAKIETPTPAVPERDAQISVLAGIESEAKVTHESDQRLLEQSRLRLEISRTNLLRALRLVEGQIEAYDRMIQIARSRAKEL